MIVLAIIGILVVLAIGAYAGGIPDSRLRESQSSVQQAMVAARSDAIRKTRFEKICLFSDPAPYDATPLGITRRFECFSAGSGGCPAALICSGATSDASTATPVAAASLTCAAGTWCEITSAKLDFSTAYYSRYKTTIWGFNNVQTALVPNATVLKGLEITFSPSGTISTPRSTGGSYTAGVILIGDTDFCNAKPPSCTAYRKTKQITYALGGTVRMGL